MIATNGLTKVPFLALLFLPMLGFAEDPRINYSESLQQLELVSSARIVDGSAKPATVSPIERMRFNAFGRQFDVVLAPNQNVLSLAVRDSLNDNVGVFRGSISGTPGSWARIVVIDDMPQGLLWDGDTLYAIEAGEDPAKGPSIFRLDDLSIPPGSMTCGATGGNVSGSDLLQAIAADVSAPVASAANAVSSLDIAVVADFEFATDNGVNAEAEIATRMNNVDGIFSEQLGVQINVTRTDVFASSDDPFTDESDAGILLDELSDYRAAEAVQFANGLSHLFTGRELDGSTVGIAYTRAICSRRFGTGLTQASNSTTLDSLIAAHEIGHNFGAPHDGTSGSACEDTPQDFLMAPRLNNSDTFSACSIAQMQAVIDDASCVAALPSLDVAVVANQPANALLGDTTSLSFVINSVGTDSATSVNFDVSVPSTVVLDSISTTLGSCTSGGGSASCSIGSISAGSSATVDLNVTSKEPGGVSFDASVTAAGDNNGSNNSATLDLTVDPAVDLVVTAAAASVAVDQQATARITIANQSSIPATAVSVEIAAGSGVRIDSADWGVGSCSVADNIATCDATSLAAQSSTTLDVQVTGLTEGSRTLSVDATANEIDRATSNNAIQAQVTVNSPNAGGNNDGGGGGSVSWTTLLLLLSVLLIRAAGLRGSGFLLHYVKLK